MWKNFFAYLQNILTLTKDVERLDSSYRRLDEKVTHLMLAVQRLSDEVRINAQHDQSERDKMRLEFKIQLMEMERRLSSAKSPEDQK
ncbi:MAG: hypothetical protein AB7U82_30225 [Blastocatellales bacterium]